MNNFELEIKPLAIKDLEDIADYIANALSNRTAAVNLIKKIDALLDSACKFPFKAKALETNAKLKHKYRWMLADNYIIFYTVDEERKKITIARIVYGASNYIKYLE